MDTHLSPVERLAQTHPDLEIWWDSSPLVYKSWVQKMLNAAEPRKRPTLETQFARLYDQENPGASVFRGCTTNPRSLGKRLGSSSLGFGMRGVCRCLTRITFAAWHRSRTRTLRVPPWRVRTVDRS